MPRRPRIRKGVIAAFAAVLAVVGMTSMASRVAGATAPSQPSAPPGVAEVRRTPRIPPAHPNAPISAQATDPGVPGGYWLVGTDGGVFAFGGAPYLGSLPGLGVAPAAPIVGMASTPNGHGYWLVGADGGVFAFGSARFYGSTGAIHLNKPVVGMASTPNGHGYWLVASDGGIFSFGDAGFYGSAADAGQPTSSVVGMAATANGGGYWEVTSGGDVYGFGDAVLGGASFYAWPTGEHLAAPIVGIVPTPHDHGYWLVAADGGVFTFGDAGFFGSAAGDGVSGPVVLTPSTEVVCGEGHSVVAGYTIAWPTGEVAFRAGITCGADAGSGPATAIRRVAGSLWPARVPASAMLPHAVVHPIIWPGDPWARRTVADVRASLAHPWVATADLGVSTPRLGRTLTVHPPRGTSGKAAGLAVLPLTATAQPQAIDVVAAGHMPQSMCGWHAGLPNRGAVAVVLAPPRRNCPGGPAITTTHELVEAATDPGWAGWHSAPTPQGGDQELADACASQTYRIDAVGDVVDPADIQVLDPHTGRCAWLWPGGAPRPRILRRAPMAAPAPGGTWAVTPAGAVTATGTAGYGSVGGTPLNKPIVGIVSTPDYGGYWLVAADGGVFAFGDAGFYGSMGGKHLAAPVVGMAATPHGHGYWLVAADGGVFAFGSARFYGSMGGKPLNKPVVGMASTPGGHGYWLVAADGGIFSFGSAGFHGSLPGLPASEQPGLAVVAMTADGTGGYWEATSGGDVYSFGDAPFYGSTGNIHLNRPIVGMVAAR